MVGFRCWWLGLLLVMAVTAGADAEDVAQEPVVLWVMERLKGDGGETPSDEAVAKKLNQLTVLVHRKGDYQLLDQVTRAAYRFCESKLGEEHHETLSALNNLATASEAQGRFGDVEPFYRRVLAIRERVLGEEHPETLVSMNNLASFYRSQGRFGEAEPLFRRALEISERVLGEKHPLTLGCVNNLAALYVSQGRYGEAEQLYQRALEVSERVLGEEHPHTLVSMNNLANVYEQQDRYEEAEPLFRRALEVSERVLGEGHPQTLEIVNNRAFLYQHQGRYAEAESLYRRALEVRGRVLGEEHPQTLVIVNNLAALYESQGRYGEAEPLYRRALEVRERVLGEEHPDTLTGVNNLAGIYASQGRYGEAEPLFRKVLEASERVLGEAHPNTLTTQLNWIALLINQEKIASAVRQLRRMDARLRRFVALQLTTTQQERVRLTLLASQSRFQDVVFSLVLAHPGPETRHLAADVLLRWKKLAGEEEARLARLVRTSRDERVVRLAKQVAERRGALARLVNLSNPGAKAVAAARAELERSETELNGLSSEWGGGTEERSVAWERVQERLPSGSALLELRLYWPTDPRAREEVELHWLALLLPADPGDGPELWVEDLGPVKASAVSQAALSVSGTDEAAADLYRVLFSGLDRRLAAYDPLYMAPDGPLELVPLSRLRLADGRYWTERQSLYHLRTGRDLLPSRQGRVGDGMVAYGGVDYGAFPEAKEAKEVKGQEVEDADAAAGSPLLAINRFLQAERGDFSPLRHTRPEAEEVAHYYWDYDSRHAAVKEGQDASESYLKHLSVPPKVLHLATHGFFLDQNRERTERPATLSGVALAGANLGMAGKLSPAGEDGILYALEAQDLNLEGTELVTLSACDTGKGEVDYSEGVYGLVRAFHIAGARNVMMTLWPIDDALGREFMAEFYRRWFEDPDQPPADALRATQLAWIRSDDPARRDPKHWAPYVMVERR